MAIQTLKHATELGVKLHVQQVFERFVEFKTKGLIQDVTPHALFMPLVVRSGDAVTERFLFTPYDDGTKVPYRDLLETTRIRCEFCINGTEFLRIPGTQY